MRSLLFRSEILVSFIAATRERSTGDKLVYSIPFLWHVYRSVVYLASRLLLSLDVLSR
jgi:hypothetical protein